MRINVIIYEDAVLLEQIIRVTNHLVGERPNELTDGVLNELMEIGEEQIAGFGRTCTIFLIRCQADGCEPFFVNYGETKEISCN